MSIDSPHHLFYNNSENEGFLDAGCRAKVLFEDIHGLCNMKKLKDKIYKPYLKT